MSYFRRAAAVSAFIMAVTATAYADQNFTPTVKVHETFGPLALGIAGLEEYIPVTLKDHHFSPAEIVLHADTRVELHVTNNDPTPAEFESDDFSAEKVLTPGHEEKIVIGPFKPGTYEFHDEYNEDVSKAKITVK